MQDVPGPASVPERVLTRIWPRPGMRGRPWPWLICGCPALDTVIVPALVPWTPTASSARASRGCGRG